jgi:4-amino-4-deoxy-L-arabinose transferase-like glycosyltransferase
MNRRLTLVAIAIAVLTTVLLAIGHRDVGYARDEGIYFAASRHYAAWFGDVVREPSKALTKAGRDRRFRVNHEHPALLKSAAGLSAALFARAPAEGTVDEDIVDTGGALPLMDEGAAMRLPAQLVTGIGAALLFVAAAHWGTAFAGLLAAAGFVLLPHVWFHAGLHAFDVPVATAILAVVLAYRRAQHSRRWAIVAGLLLGVAVAFKHNALFVGPLLALHHFTTLALAKWRDGRVVRPSQWIGLHLVSMATLGPLVALALWPWMWSDTFARIGEYFTFHRQHAYYNMEFLGQNLNQPPMPMSYPFVMTWATVPTVLLVLAIVGAVWLVRREWATKPATTDAGSFACPLPRGWSRHDGLLFVIMAAFPIVLIALPSTPIFGGTKHWITAYPFFALLAARAWTLLWQHISAPRWWQPAALGVVLLPAAISTIDGHPFGMSQYSPLVGGARGAADLGLGRGFWGYAIAPRLPVLAETLAGRQRLYVHDVHDLAVLQYRREGRWPQGVVPTPIVRAQAGLLFHELHMATWEYQLWEQLGTAAPVDVVTLDGVPLVSIYATPERQR